MKTKEILILINIVILALTVVFYWGDRLTGKTGVYYLCFYDKGEAWGRDLEKLKEVCGEGGNNMVLQITGTYGEFK